MNDRCIVTRAENLDGSEDFISDGRSSSRHDDNDDDNVELTDVDNDPRPDDIATPLRFRYRRLTDGRHRGSIDWNIGNDKMVEH